MAGNGATLALKITGDATGGLRAMDEAEGKAGRLDGVFGKLGAGIAVGAAVGGAALLKLGADSFTAASDLQQSTGAIDAVFGDWAVDIEQSAQKADMALGLSTSAYENLAAVIGAQLAGAGMAHDEMTDKTQALISKGADLAATFGGTTAEAVEALSSVLKGETDPVERYGVSIKQSDISARLAAEGNDKLTGAALKTATANAALALVSEQTASSTGAFAKESDTAAGAQERLSAKFENIKATLGEKLLPIFTEVANWVMDKAIPAFEKFTEKGGPLNDIMDKLGKFWKEELLPTLKDLWQFLQDNVLPIWQDVAGYIKDDVVPAFGKIWDFVKTYVIPIFKETLKPALEGIRDAFKTVAEKIADNRDKFQEIYDKAKPFLDFIRDKVAPIVGETLKVAFEGAGKAIGAVIDSVAWILDKGATIANWLFGVNDSGGGGSKRGVPARSAAPALFGAARGGLFTAGSSLPGGTSGPAAAGQGLLEVGATTVNVTINGALDPVAVGRQVNDALTTWAQATGRQLAVAR
jgi:hypothetical protein